MIQPAMTLIRRAAGAGLRQRAAAEYLALAAVSLLALGLRMYRLGDWSFWVDEVYTLGYARDLISHDPLYFLLRHPISTKLIAALIAVVPASEWTARLIPALIGALSVPLLYAPSRRIFGPSVALTSALLLAIAPWHIYWSQNARFYTALLLTYSLALLYLFIALREGRRWMLALGGVLLLMAIRERLMALFAVPVLLSYAGLIWLAHGRGRRPPPWGLILVALGAPLLYLAYDLGHAWLLGHQPATLAFFEIYVGASTPGPSMLSLVGHWLGLPLVGLALTGALYLLVARRTPESLFLVLCVAVPLAALLALAPFSATQDRYVFVTLPFWTLLAAITIRELYAQLRGSGRILAIGVLALLLVDPALQARAYYLAEGGFRPDWRGAFALVAERRSPGAIIYTTKSAVGEHYLGQPVRDDEGLTPEQIVAAGRETWLVLDTQYAWPSRRLRAWLAESARLVDERRTAAPGRQIWLRVYLYRPDAQGRP